MNTTSDSRNTSNQQGNTDVALLRLNTKIFKMTEENVNVNKELLTEIKKMNKKLDDLFKVTLTDYVVNFPLSNNITYHKEEESLSYMYKEKISNFIFRMNPENLSVKDASDFIRKNNLKLGEMVSQDINNLTIDWSGNNISAPTTPFPLGITTNMSEVGDQLTYLIGAPSKISDSQRYLLSIKNTDEQLTQLYLDYTSYELFTRNLLQAVEIIINEIQKLSYSYTNHYSVLYDSLKDALNKLKYPRYYRIFTKNNYGETVDLKVGLKDTLLNSITTNPTDATNGTLTDLATTTSGTGSGAKLNVIITGNKVTSVTVTKLKMDANELLSSITSNPTDATNNAGLESLSTTTSGTGTGAILTLVISGNTVTSVTVTTAGIGYMTGDTITVSNTLISGTSTDLVITLDDDDFVTAGSGYKIGDTITVSNTLIAGTSTDLVITFGANNLEQNITKFVDRDYLRISRTLYNLNSNLGANTDFDYTAGDGDKFDEVSRFRSGFLIRKVLNQLLSTYNSLKLKVKKKI